MFTQTAVMAAVFGLLYVAQYFGFGPLAQCVSLPPPGPEEVTRGLQEGYTK
jgi:hypothetical protein